MNKFAHFAMMNVLVILTTTSCTNIVGIEQNYYLRGRCEPQPLVVAEKQEGASYIALDATNIYWTNRVGGQVMKMDIDGDSAKPLAEKQKSPRCIAVDATHVYWTNGGDIDAIGQLVPNTGSVMRIAIDGSEPMPTILADSQNAPYDIVVTDEFIFWTNEGTPPPAPPTIPELDGSIMRLDRNKTDPITLFPNLNYPQGIAVYETTLYWTDVEYLNRTTIDGDKWIEIDKLPPEPKVGKNFSNIAVSSEGVFWTDTDNSKVKKVNITGGEPEQLAAYTQTPFDIAVDATTVYWTSTYDHTVSKVGINGDTAITLAEDQASPVGIAVSGTCIYWANQGDGTIMKREK